MAESEVKIVAKRPLGFTAAPHTTAQAAPTVWRTA